MIGALRGFTLHNYVTLFTLPELRNMIVGTLFLALVVAVLSSVLGTLGAIGTFYSRRRMRKGIGFVNQIPVINADGKQTEVYIGLETTTGQWLSLKALMGLSSLRGYVLDGTMTDAQKIEHFAKVAEDVTEQFIGWPDCPTRDLYELTARIEAGEVNMKGRTVTYKGQAYRPFKAKKGGQKDYASNLVIKKDDQRAQDAKLWEVA